MDACVMTLYYLQLFLEIPDPVTCPNPLAPANRGVTITGSNIGATATYTCDPGFELDGDDTATCTDNGDGTASFQPDTPVCQGK